MLFKQIDLDPKLVLLTRMLFAAVVGGIIGFMIGVQMMGNVILKLIGEGVL